MWLGVGLVVMCLVRGDGVGRGGGGSIQDRCVKCRSLMSEIHALPPNSPTPQCSCPLLLPSHLQLVLARDKELRQLEARAAATQWSHDEVLRLAKLQITRVQARADDAVAAAASHAAEEAERWQVQVRPHCAPP